MMTRRTRRTRRTRHSSVLRVLQAAIAVALVVVLDRSADAVPAALAAGFIAGAWTASLAAERMGVRPARRARRRL